MNAFRTRWGRSGNRFGDLAVLGFVCVQALDGAFTYLGIRTWGPMIEANPLITSAASVAGLGAALTGAKLVAVTLGIGLHMHRVHGVVALLTAIYLAAAILPWTAVFLTQ